MDITSKVYFGLINFNSSFLSTLTEKEYLYIHTLLIYLYIIEYLYQDYSIQLLRHEKMYQ